MPEAVAWWPLRRGREQFDLTPTLSPAERAALAAYAAVLLDGPPAARRGRSPDPATLAALHRLEAPVAAVWELAGTQRAAYLGARRVLFAATRRHDRPYWAWDRTEWLAVLCPSSKAFTATYGVGVQHARSIVLAVAYLFGDVTDLRPAGLSQTGVRLAEIVFGDAAAAALARIRSVLHGPTGLGYAESVGQWQRLRWTTCLALLLNRSPRLEEASLAFLQALAREAPTCHACIAVPQLAQAMQALGLLTWTPAPSGYPEHVAPGADAGVAPEWAAWCWAWYRRDTQLGQATRRGVLAVGFMVGRWLQEHHPDVTTPEQWDEDLALDYVHYLCAETRIGDDLIPDRKSWYIPPAKLGRARRCRGRSSAGSPGCGACSPIGRPGRTASPGSRRAACRCDLNPQQALATPRRLRELVHPRPARHRPGHLVQAHLRRGPPGRRRTSRRASAGATPSRCTARWPSSGSRRRGGPTNCSGCASAACGASGRPPCSTRGGGSRWRAGRCRAVLPARAAEQDQRRLLDLDPRLHRRRHRRLGAAAAGATRPGGWDPKDNACG